MVGVEQQVPLRFIKTLLSKGFFSMMLWQDDRSDLFVQIPLDQPGSSVIFQTSNHLLLQFFANDCTLQQLYQQAVSPFGWLKDGAEFTQIYLPDAGLMVRFGNSCYASIKQQ